MVAALCVTMMAAQTMTATAMTIAAVMTIATTSMGSWGKVRFVEEKLTVCFR